MYRQSFIFFLFYFFSSSVALQRNEHADKSVQRKLLGSVVTVSASIQNSMKQFTIIVRWKLFQGAWNNKKIVEANQKLMRTVYDRYSLDGLKDYNDADVLNAEIDFELNDVDRYSAILNTHFNTSKVSSVYQMIALMLLTEGSSGKFVSI